MSEFSQKELIRQVFKYEDALKSYAYSMCRDWSAAEDIVHEAYLVLIEKWESYSPEYSVYSWVRKMVYFKTMEHFRRRKRDVVMDDPDLIESIRLAMDMEMDEEAAKRYALRMKVLDKCMEKLGSTAKDLVVRYYWNNEQCDDIAAKLKRSVNSVWLALSRIRKNLRECVERHAGNVLSGIEPGEAGEAI